MPRNSSLLPRRGVIGAAAAAVLGAALPGAWAQSGYPNKPIRFIVPYPPGGGTDIVVRLVAQKLSVALKQQVVVDNKPGASTIIGTELLARAAPDGYTVGLVADSLVTNPSLFPKLPYDSVKDFAPIGQMVGVPLMMVAHPSLGVKTLREFIALAKARPGRINYASIGAGSPHQLAMEWLRLLAGIEVTHVPYKGVAGALTDVVAGQVEVMFTGTSTAAPYIKDGRLVPLAVSSGKRQPAFPNVPAVAEVLSEFDMMTWYGVAAPAGTPKEITRRLSREIAAILAQPDVRERLSGLGLVPSPSTPDDFSAFMRREAVRQGRMVRLTGIKVD